jgi:hypothetical protein
VENGVTYNVQADNWQQILTNKIARVIGEGLKILDFQEDRKENTNLPIIVRFWHVSESFSVFFTFLSSKYVTKPQFNDPRYFFFFCLFFWKTNHTHSYTYVHSIVISLIIILDEKMLIFTNFNNLKQHGLITYKLN